MFSYARRHLLRVRSAFLILFLSVALAVTLFPQRFSLAATFSIAFGLDVVLVMMRGKNVVYNAVYSVLLHRIVFPPSALTGPGGRGLLARAFDSRADTGGHKAHILEPGLEDRGTARNDVGSCEAWQL
jgi:hypothetical protein